MINSQLYYQSHIKNSYQYAVKQQIVTAWSIRVWLRSVSQFRVSIALLMYPVPNNTIFFSAEGVKEENDVKLKKCWVFLSWSEEWTPFAK